MSTIPHSVNFSLTALLSHLGDSVPRERYQEPALSQNANGTFFIRPWVDVMTESGLERRKKTINLGVTTKREAILARRRAMETINRASYIIQSQISFAALADEYEKFHVVRQSSSTQGKYRCHLKNHIRPAFDALQLHEVTANRVQEWLDLKPLSWNTKCDLRNIMSGMFKFAIGRKYWQDSNPIEPVTAGRKKLTREKRKISDDHTRRILAALPSDVRTMASVALFTGARVSEILGLCEKHLDFDAGTIYIEQRWYRGNLDDVKTRKAERKIPMGHLAADLQLLCMGDPERYLFQIVTRPEWGTKTAVCRDDRDILQHFLRPAAVAVGCYWTGFGWHSFRREAITAFNASLGVTQAMRLAGHATADMSLEYTLADHDQQDKAIRDRAEKIMGKTSGTQ